MYNFLSLLTGWVIAIMVAINGRLTLQYGNFNAAVIIHVVGVVFAFLLCMVMGKRISLQKGLPLWFYSGGAIGVLTTVFTNFSYGKISLTSIVALGLLGQTVASLVTDCFGLFGMKKHPFSRSSVLGLVFSIAGIGVMLENPVDGAVFAVLLSFCSGATVVLSRTVNARLSHHIGDLQGSFVNHAVGLPITVIMAIAFSDGSSSLAAVAFPRDLWMYFGGILGVSIVVLSNMVVPKIPSFRLTLLTFVGQVFMGIAIDMFTKSGFTGTTFVGGLLVAVGISLNMVWEQLLRRKRVDGEAGN